MKRDYKLYLNDMKESIKQIEEYVHNVSEESFKKEKIIQDAVIRRLEIVGEASRNIPRAVKENNKEMPWFELSNFRDFISHSYFEASLDRVWKIVKNRIPFVKKCLGEIKLI